jgi:hypothetical protein
MRLISNSYNYLRDIEGAEIRGIRVRRVNHAWRKWVDKCPHSLLVERFSRVPVGVGSPKCCQDVLGDYTDIAVG